jgi:putative transposase
MATFRDIKTLQKFSSAHASIHNHFYQQRHLIQRDDYKTKREASLIEGQQLAAA